MLQALLGVAGMARAIPSLYSVPHHGNDKWMLSFALGKLADLHALGLHDCHHRAKREGMVQSFITYCYCSAGTYILVNNISKINDPIFCLYRFSRAANTHSKIFLHVRRASVCLWCRMLVYLYTDVLCIT